MMRVWLTKIIRLRSNEGLWYHNAYTLIELIVVIAITTVIISIVLPALNQVRRKSRTIIGMNNQRQIVNAVNFFAVDNDQFYPESVATIGDQDYWNWQEPMMLTGYRARSPRLHRSLSGYLSNYIEDAEILFCPNAPNKYKYLQQSWDAADDWDNPDTPPVQDPVSGTYCFYWNYTGYIEGNNKLFKGPVNGAGGKNQSNLLVSDYFGFNHWRSRNSYSSCEMFENSSVIEGTLLSSDYWSCLEETESDLPQISLHAGYTDGHVEKFSSVNTFPMRVIIDPKKSEPYPDDIAPGIFYLPKNALH
ncbi:MAG: type II secretion system protein [Sedimentisphaerales bacterium]|nr:type II secretion system protein [Sedimentisphaerales bacterium]